MPTQFLPAVKAQYESFPYPPRDPADEAHRIIHAISGNLLVINHHCFGGHRDFRKGFRCLVAGGGTGDSTIYLAEQLRDHDAEIVYLDMSSASREIAEQRAAVRKLRNIRWETASIMELDALGLGEFDYIECCGVLHHLESTEAGLRMLAGSLKPDGAIFLMLYGKYGRRAVYDMQSLLKAYLPAEASMQEKIGLTRKLLAELPSTNRLIRDLDSFREEITPGTGLGDAGLYDLFLHSQDRCFTVPELHELADGADLHLLGFSWSQAAYDPETHIADREICDRIRKFDRRTRQAIAELICGSISKHEFFLARDPGRGATLKDDTLALRSFGTLLDNAPKLALDMVPGRSLSYKDPEHSLRIECNAITREIYGHMDGKTSLKKLRKLIRRRVPGVTPEQIDQELKRVFNQLHPRGYLYLIGAGQYGTTVPDYSLIR